MYEYEIARWQKIYREKRRQGMTEGEAVASMECLYYGDYCELLELSSQREGAHALFLEMLKEAEAEYERASAGREAAE